MAFLETDRVAGDESVVVINQALADQYFPGRDPVGERIALGEGWSRVVGVVENVAEAGLADEAAPARYVLYDHVPGLGEEHSTVVKTGGGGDPAAVPNAARRAVQGAAPGVAVRELTTLENVFNRAIGPARQVMALLALLGALALALGSIGVYGVGIAVGLGGFRLLASFLYGVGTADPLALAGATAVLMGAGLLAAYLPARRASRIDPAGVLREQ